MQHTDTVCIGAGPAGLTAAYLLSKKGLPVTVLEQDPSYVGGISKTINYNGFLFDIGGHRFFSKSQEVQALWEELLGDDMLIRPRSSSIYYNRKFFSYPLKAQEALLNLGPLEASRCVASYLKARIFPVQEPANFEEWVTNEFGKRLFTIFFKTYTEKVWGMDCKEISADWAAQRIKGLSLGKAIYHAVVPQKEAAGNGKVIKTLINTFQYPRRGPGMMWEATAKKIQALGGQIILDSKVIDFQYHSPSQEWLITFERKGQPHSQIWARNVISSIPLRELINNLKPKPTLKTLEAANALRYRDFLTVAIILRDRNVFTENWIYIHEPDVRVGRIQNFKSWSPEMVPDPASTCYGLEYFCNDDEDLWSLSNPALIEMARRELELLGLAHQDDFVDGYVVRQPKAYPVYDGDYASKVEIIRDELETFYPGLFLVGRNGMHKYNNQDHAMMTAMLTVENIIEGEKVYDVWNVNEDASYHETIESDNEGATGIRLTPKRVLRAA